MEQAGDKSHLRDSSSETWRRDLQCYRTAYPRKWGGVATRRAGTVAVEYTKQHSGRFCFLWHLSKKGWGKGVWVLSGSIRKTSLHVSIETTLLSIIASYIFFLDPFNYGWQSEAGKKILSGLIVGMIQNDSNKGQDWRSHCRREHRKASVHSTGVDLCFQTPSLSNQTSYTHN